MNKARFILGFTALLFYGCGQQLKAVTESSVPYTNTKSLAFDGALSQHLVIGQPSSLEFNPQGSEFTVAAWIKATSATTSGVIISKSAQAGANRQVQLSIAGTKALEAFVGGNYLSSGVDVVTDGLWHHVALVNKNVAGTYQFNLYVDGVLAGSAQTSGAATNTNDWLIGARRNLTNSDTGFLMTTGLIDEVAVWSSALPVTELAALAVPHAKDVSGPSGAYVSSTSLVSWWRMGDAAGDSPTGMIYDVRGGNNATAVNLVSGSASTSVP